MIYTITRFLALVFCRLIFRYRITGRKDIPAKGGVILASNHSSFLDPIILSVASSRRISFMARSTLFKNRMFGALIRGCGAFPIVRGKGDVGALNSVEERLDKGEMVLMFPEGSRSRDGNLGRARTGVGYLSVKTNVAVMPAYVKGAFEAWPKGARFIRSVKVSVHFGKPIFPEFHQQTEGREQYRIMADRVMGEIGKLKERFDVNNSGD